MINTHNFQNQEAIWKEIENLNRKMDQEIVITIDNLDRSQRQIIEISREIENIATNLIVNRFNDSILSDTRQKFQRLDGELKSTILISDELMAQRLQNSSPSNFNITPAKRKYNNISGDGDNLNPQKKKHDNYVPPDIFPSPFQYVNNNVNNNRININISRNNTTNNLNRIPGIETATKPKKREKTVLREIFNHTEKCFKKRSYKVNKNPTRIDNSHIARSENGTIVHNSPSEISHNLRGRYPSTQIRIVQNDTIEAGLQAQRRYSPNEVVILNFANATSPGGGVRNGAKAQEEDICRRSNLLFCLEKTKYHGRYQIPEFGTIFTPDVICIKDSNYNTKYPKHLNVISAAAYDLKNHNMPHNFEENTKHKMRAILRTAASHGCTVPVLGAFGCGAFRNNPNDIARYWRDILREPEFQGVFQEVIFAILDEMQGPNITAFNNTF